MLINFTCWSDAAEYCEDNFGSFVDWEEEYFICPECEEPIYADDWENHYWYICPICEMKWEDIE